ncbi:MAG: DivIVA domain-containing protein [Christensenellales bacterium]
MMEVMKKLFRRVFFGYSAKQVRAYYEQSQAEFAILERTQEEYRLKCGELQQQLEEYQQREREMGRVMVNASIVAKNIVNEAELESKRLLESAEQDIQAKLAACDEKLHQKTLALQAMESEISSYREMCRRHASQLLGVLDNSREEETGRKSFGSNVVVFSEDKKQA